VAGNHDLILCKILACLMIFFFVSGDGMATVMIVGFPCHIHTIGDIGAVLLFKRVPPMVPIQMPSTKYHIYHTLSSSPSSQFHKTLSIHPPFLCFNQTNTIQNTTLQNIYNIFSINSFLLSEVVTSENVTQFYYKEKIKSYYIVKTF